MKTELYKISDYANLKSWWVDRWGHAPSIQSLPQSGLIVSKDGVNLAAGWVYLDMTSPVAVIGWIVSNPENTALQSGRAIRYLIKGLLEVTRSQGRLHVMTTASGSLTKTFQACGFDVKESGHDNLSLTLN